MVNNMTIYALQNEILRLKKEKDICILAHSYQRREIVEIADFTGDSYALAKKAMNVPQQNILMCGVRFMAETVKILNPEKRVFLSHRDAGCPMAEQFDKATLAEIKNKFPGYAVVAYINTTSELKTLCDVCVTSSSAEKIIRAMPEKNIIFIPDINLGTYCKEHIPEKNFELFQGGCPAHAAMTKADVIQAKNAHPKALLLVHPECPKAVSESADYVGSTAGIMTFAKESMAKEFIIGTENSIVEHLSYECPDKKFYPLSKNLICSNMQLTTLSDVYRCLVGDNPEEITMAEETRISAKRCIDRMIEYGG